MATLPNYMTEEAGLYMAGKIKEKAPIASPEFTGTPIAPTPASGLSNDQVATTAFVQDAIANAELSIYTPKGTVDGVEDLPTDPETGDVWQVNDDIVVDKDGNLNSLTIVDTYADLPTVDTTNAGSFAKVTAAITSDEINNDGDNTEVYPAGSVWYADGSTNAWVPLTSEIGELKEGPNYVQQTEEDGWTVIPSPEIDLSAYTKIEYAEQTYQKKDEMPEPVPLATVQGWFDETTTPDPDPAPTYTAVTPTGSEDPSALGWYEIVSGEYELSQDTTVDGGKTYYTKD